MNESIMIVIEEKKKERKKERKKEETPHVLFAYWSAAVAAAVGASVASAHGTPPTLPPPVSEHNPRRALFSPPPSSPFSCMGYRPLILCFVFFFLFSIWKETYLISLLAAKSWAMETLVIVADNNRLTFRQISIQFSPNSKHFRSVSTKANIQVY